MDAAHQKCRSRLCVCVGGGRRERGEGRRGEGRGGQGAREGEGEREREYKTKKQSNIQRTSLPSQLFFAKPPLEAVKVLVSKHDVCRLVEDRETDKVETLRHLQSTLTRNSPGSDTCPSSKRKIDRIMVKTKLAD